MEYSVLGSSGEKVSRACLGSMTWGLQNTQQEANQQLDYAMSKDINFIDTAEMYPVPPSPGRFGHTEKIIGNWLSLSPTIRSKIFLATKIVGPGLGYIRDGANITGETVIGAIDDSLKRLQTDYIDLFQLHWPNRPFPHFAKHKPGRITFTDLDAEQEEQGMLEILKALDTCVKAGKIRYCGLSNDTPWGLSTYTKLSKAHNLPKMVSVQNEFSLLHAKDWPYLIETCVRENIAYLPWSPLAGGVLSGKYLNGQFPKGTRWTLEQRNGIFRNTPAVHAATAKYVELAEKIGITPAQLALAWCNQVDGVTSSIIGATSLEQLKENIDAFDIHLSQDAINDVHDIFAQYPVPF
jgi:aryl-alcohol dehydrogenase-like predicted oxidoreductase